MFIKDIIQTRNTRNLNQRLEDSCIRLRLAARQFDKEFLTYKTMQVFYDFALKIDVIGLSDAEIRSELHAIEKDVEFSQMDERVYNHLITKKTTL